MEGFVRDYGTGPNIPDPIRFHSYAKTNEPSPRPGIRPSQYTRSSSRTVPTRNNSAATPTTLPTQDEDLGQNMAGLGAPGRNGFGPQSTGATQAPLSNGYTGVSQGSYGALPPSSTTSLSRDRESPPRAAPPPQANPVRLPPGAQALPGLSSGQNGPLNGPPAPAPANDIRGYGNSASQPAIAPLRPALTSGTTSSVGDSEDPIAKALEDLKKGNARKRNGSLRRGGAPGSPPATAVGRGGTLRRTGANGYDQPPQQSAPPSSDIPRSPVRKAPPNLPQNDSFGPPHQAQPMQPQTSGGLDLSMAADSIVGAHPSSRPSSPQPPASPRAAFMQAPPRAVSPGIVEDYEQALPGERASRRLSVRRGGQQQGGSSRPTSPRPTTPSQEPFAGIGAHGRSPSPQPGQIISRGVSPNPNARPMSTGPGGYPQQQQQPPQNQYQQQQLGRIQSPANDPRLARAPSPSIGIAIDSRGNVAHDALAEDYARRNNPQQQQPSYGQQPPYQQPGPGQARAQQPYNTGGPPPQPQNSYQYPDQTGATGYGGSIGRQFQQQQQPPQQQPLPPQQHPVRQGSYDSPGGGNVQRQGSFNNTSPPSNHPYAQSQYQRTQPPMAPPPQTAPPQPPQQQNQFYSSHPYAQPPPATQQPYSSPQPPPQQPQALPVQNAYTGGPIGQPQRQPSLTPATTGYGGSPQQQQQQPPPQSNTYTGYSQPPPQQQQQRPPQQQQQAYQNTGYAQPPAQQQYQQPPPQHLQQPPQQQPAHQIARTPSPRAPPATSRGNNPGSETLDDGTPILFYGKRVTLLPPGLIHVI